ncbi:unnamed protein product, partial [Pylaiella littoralis]
AVKIVHTDNGGEFDGRFEEVCRELCMKQEKPPPHSPQFNGIAERALGLIKDAARAGLIQAMVIFSDAPNFPSLWAEAMAWRSWRRRLIRTSVPSSRSERPSVPSWS